MSNSAIRYRIHPRIGVARLGNSTAEFYLGPEKTGGLPIACDERGDPVVSHGEVQHVRQFKDAVGAVKRQAARFKVFAHDGAGAAREVTVGQDGIKAIRWTVHLANKKPIWFTFSELNGDLEFGEWNSYERRHVPLNNPDTTDPKQRKALMIDPGPRSVGKPGERTAFSRYNIPQGYNGSFPPTSLSPAIDSLGDLIMDSQGRLLVLGGYGNSAGTSSITSFRGASGWWDDISDGYVLCTLTLDDGSTLDLEPAWVIVGSPKYAPELVNIVTLDDTMYDIAVRFLHYNRSLYDAEAHPGKHPDGSAYDPFAGFNPDYRPSFTRDILPILERPETYRWVAQVPSMIEFSRPRFDPSDASEKNKARRERYFSFFRVPVPPQSYKFIGRVENGPNTLFGKDGVPLMPLNSGDNSVTNELIYKFLTLTPTQYFFLSQWAKGVFDPGDAPPDNHDGVTELDRQVVGNLVGGPFSPGIETTWIVRSPRLYRSAFNFAIAHWEGNNEGIEAYYQKNGLSLTSDPQNGDGTEPGDLTKRMAIPWQSDFFECTVQTPNITNPAVNQGAGDNGIQVPPAYYVYWWPPQSPMQVVTGDLNPGNQVLDGFVSAQAAQFSGVNGLTLGVQSFQGYSITAAGQTVPYSRGINSFAQMVASWADLGFVVNKGPHDYPYFVETERNTAALAQGAALGTK